MQQPSSAAQKVAVVERAVDIARVHVLECTPAQEPDQLPSTKPALGTAVSVTFVPRAKDGVQTPVHVVLGGLIRTALPDAAG